MIEIPFDICHITSEKKKENTKKKKYKKCWRSIVEGYNFFSAILFEI